MKIDRRLVLLGVMLVVLSTVMATQYATTKVAYTFGIVHPSNADIRFIGSDNSSMDNKRVLRVTTNASTTMFVEIQLGDWMPSSEKNYTAAFAIVNEEMFKVNISFVNVSGAQASYMSVWLHGNRTKDVSSEIASAKVRVVNAGTSVFSAGKCPWKLGTGNANPANMNGTAGAVTTPWDGTSNVRYSESNVYAINGTRDFVWVEVCLKIPSNAPTTTATGTIFIHFEASTH